MNTYSNIKHNIPIYDTRDYESHVEFCRMFFSGLYPRYILGRTEYAKSISNEISVDGYIDDFTDEIEFLGKPIVKSDDLRSDSLVVVAVVGRPFTARAKLNENGLLNLDYFTFRKYSGLNLLGIWDWDEFESEFHLNREKYEYIYSLLNDDMSKSIFAKLINFRLTSDLSIMEGFMDTQKRQYFEEFVNLDVEGLSFVDVGSFDGFTSLQFIQRSPNYNNIYIFEPDPKNIQLVKKALSNYRDIQYYNFGLSDDARSLRFSSKQQESRVNEYGDIEINVRPLDSVLNDKYFFLKMDIEGGELQAIRGARNSIIKNHPILAISVYHRCTDFWKIPFQILEYRTDYDIYIRHYIEGVSETVMYFIPK